MNTQPKAFYSQRIDTLEEQLKTIKKKLFASSMTRLTVFVAVSFGVYFFFGNTQLVLATVLLGIITFVFLVSRHNDLSYQKKLLQQLLFINRKELKALQREVSDFPEGNEFKEDSHYYSQDIDLFGKGSFFQYLNRTATQEGAVRLANLLKSNDISNILRKQNTLKELSQKAEWRQLFTAHALVSSSEIATQRVVGFLKSHKPFILGLVRYLPMIFSAISVGVFTLYFLGLITEMQLLLWFFIGVGTSGFFFKKVTNLSGKGAMVREVFYQNQQLIALLESENFEDETLQKFKKSIQTEGVKASQVIKQFSKYLDALDQRNNLIFGVVANGFFLWDIYQSHRIEQWIAENANQVAQWFSVLTEIDVQNSLANFVFNHQQYCFPSIVKGENRIEAKGFVHPLLDPKKAIVNDFNIENQQFFIITGANMAGKSTFLRTVSLGIVMANLGLPVCASAFAYNPIKLITSMRTSDSLTDDESYFFSELKRLKFIVEQIQQDNYFIILDEILKGTNSTDKALGSRKFIEKLVASQSTGIIATHDLSLCEVEKHHSEVKNFYFDAEIINDELHFDYTLKNGIAQNMNASFLLRKMKIVDD
jgi:hypothetical protein